MEFCKVAREGHLTIVTLDRPEVMNAMHYPAHLKLEKVWDDFAADPEQWVGILTGAGDRAFSAGNDLKYQAAGGKRGHVRSGFGGLAMRFDLDKPVIAAINGLARGAGMDMALMCDLRIMAESATLAQSYINMGLIAGDAGTYFLPRIVGTARALELFWTGRALDAREAERVGIATRVVPDDQLTQSVAETARSIAAKPQDAIRMFKRAVYQSFEMPLAAHLDMVSSHMSVIIDTPEHKALVDAFLQRRRKE